MVIALPSAVPLYFSLEFLKVEGMETVKMGLSLLLLYGGVDMGLFKALPREDPVHCQTI